MAAVVVVARSFRSNLQVTVEEREQVQNLNRTALEVLGRCPARYFVRSETLEIGPSLRTRGSDRRMFVRFASIEARFVGEGDNESERRPEPNGERDVGGGLDGVSYPRPSQLSVPPQRDPESQFLRGTFVRDNATCAIGR